ncbi:MAG: O-antigen ligase family protein [Aggregatilineales bacterium]
MILEPLILTGIVLAFWHHSPPVRDNWVGLLWLAIPVFRLRLLAHRRLWTYTVLIDSFLLFILLSVFNFQNAPLSRANYPVLICRPLLGIWLYIYLSDHARQYGMKLLIAASISIGLLIGVLALTATQWEVGSKYAIFETITNALPRINYRDIVPDMMLSFNPNEIAGAIAWFCPLMAGLMLYRPADEKPKKWQTHGIRVSAGVGFIVLFSALLSGQSRFALAGVLVSLFFIVLLLVDRPRLKYSLMTVLGVIAVIQVILLLNLLPDTQSSAIDAAVSQDTASTGLSGRDSSSLGNRIDIWESGLKMMLNNPATGTGMSMYRTAAFDPRYQIPSYAARNTTPPHAHNEWIQIGADMGVPGVLLLCVWYGGASWFLWRGWHNGDKAHRVLVVSIGTGLLAHGIYALGDAITLWDRYSFLFWFMLGLAAAQYTALQSRQPEQVK